MPLSSPKKNLCPLPLYRVGAKNSGGQMSALGRHHDCIMTFATEFIVKILVTVVKSKQWSISRSPGVRALPFCHTVSQKLWRYLGSMTSFMKWLLKKQFTEQVIRTSVLWTLRILRNIAMPHASGRVVIILGM